MAKSSVKQINKTIHDIAKTCHFSRQKVWRVIKNLEKNNTIWGYTAVINQEKLNKKIYIMLIKRTNKPIPKELINQITSREIPKKVKKWGVDFINSIYLNGRYDYMISFYANNLKDAKKVVELYNQLYPGIVSEIDLHEEMFSVQRSGINNPEINKFKDFFNS
jgi:DNA-binding Lrp family transcriptional regulator